MPAVSASEHGDFPVVTTARHTWEIIGDGEREARTKSLTRNPSLLHCRRDRKDNWWFRRKNDEKEEGGVRKRKEEE